MSKYQLTRTDDRGIYRRDDGALLVRVRLIDPQTEKEKDTMREVPRDPGQNARGYRLAALKLQQIIRSDIGDTAREASDPHQRFKDYAERRIAQKFEGTQISPSTHAKYKDELERYLIDKWGAMYLDKIEMNDVRAWMAEQGAMVTASKRTPHTVNGYWQLFKWILADASIEFRMPNPCERIPGISLSLHQTYSLKQPNALELDELPDFFKATRSLAPEFYAYFFLGIMTGRRACELRPLRVEGEDSDLDWRTGMLQVRRSQVGEFEPSNRLKQKKDVLAVLPKLFLETFEWHRGNMPARRRFSDLLFPPFVTTRSGYMHKNASVKALKLVCAKAKIKKHLSDRFMRRSFYAIGDGGKIDNIVLKAISGHHTDAMREHYSHISEHKSKAALTKMLKVAGLENI